MPTTDFPQWQPLLHRLLNDYRSQVLLAAAGFCLGCALSLLINRELSDQRAHHLANEHARDIASLGADQAGKSLFNNDLLGLRVLLTDMARLQQVQGLTVHDVENRILAQAGTIAPPGQSIHQSAAITQNDNVAGYLTVITPIVPSNSPLNLWLGALTLALAAVFATLYWRTFRPFEAYTDEDDASLHSEQDETYLDESSKAQHDSSLFKNSVALAFHSDTLTTMAHQLSEERFAEQLEAMLFNLNSVATLYNARIVYTGQSLPTLLFRSQDQSQNTLHALCCGQLMMALSYQLEQPINLQAHIEPLALSADWANNPQRAKSARQKMFLGVAEPLIAGVDDRITFNNETGYWRETQAFNESYQQLLDNQLQQLLSQGR